ncbi:MAG: molybdenum cofactor biosynthesis protein MoaE [Planctomycetes bacterium]|nr:molybdenum cofactor biosynthesis protein MoaE [Planctomycetota bacterium]
MLMIDMQLNIQFFAVLRERAGRSEVMLSDLPQGLTMGDLKCRVLQQYPDLGDLADVCGVVGTEYVKDDRVLAEGESIAFLPPVSGGQPDYEKGVFLLQEGAIDSHGMEEPLVQGDCGGLVMFRGLTRSSSRGRSDVLSLQYEVFEPMAGPEMARIFDECRERFGEHARGPLRMLCVHSGGVVKVGETSVVVAVATPHRDTAFEACRFLIDELKERLPVWKKEVYADGEAWVEGCEHAH